MTVLTLNTWHDETARAERQCGAAALINETAAEVVMLQEVPFEDLEGSLARITEDTDMRVAATAEGATSCTAVLTSGRATPLPPIEAEGADSAWRTAYAVAGIEIRGISFLAASVHQPWGGWNEAARVRAARHADETLRLHLSGGKYAGAVMAGDFNAEAHAESIRYLTACSVIEDTSTQWVDAWAVCGEGDGTTSSPENPWAVQVARRHVEIPTLIMERRIDYVLVHGWAHGKVLTPLRCTVHQRREENGSNPSDHWAVSAELYLPH